MTKPRYRWWGYVKNIIRAFPRLNAELEALRQASIVPPMGEEVIRAGVGHPTENAALRELPDKTEQREYEAVYKAIQQTRSLDDAEERLEMVDLIFWKQTHTIEGVAQRQFKAWRTVAEWHGDFIRQVAVNCNLLDEKSLHKKAKKP